MKNFLLFIFIIGTAHVYSQKLKLGLLKYGGGGDWYANPSALTNLARFCNQEIKTNLDQEAGTVEVGSPDLFNYPFVHMTGHGNVHFTNKDAENLRTYLMAGGFLHISDNYGMDNYIRRELKKVFPDATPEELSKSHPIYHQKFEFSNGLPKIHEHDNKPAKGYGITYNGRLVVFYDYECDLSDGWEDREVHNDSEETRNKALRMGANLLQFVFNGQQTTERKTN
jgi:hypothetical protein